MRTDKTYGAKITTLREFFRNGWVFESLTQMSVILGYTNKAWVKYFFLKLLNDGILSLQGTQYIPTEKLIVYPLYESVRAGLPFTPETNPPNHINVDKYLIEHPASTFFIRVKWDSMKDAGIVEGDIVILDRSLTPKNGDIVIASLDGDVTLKYFEKKWEKLKLIPANESYIPIIVNGPCEILGVVCGTVRKYH